VVLAHANHKEEAIAKCKEGLAMNPPDSRLRAMLSGLQQALGGGHEGPVVVGTGTGFCIAANGYLLTNHHVIAGAKKVMVRFCGQEKTVEAKVLAETEELDMALLKVEVPAEIELKPVPLVSAAPQRGDDVCALGYPGIGTDSPTPIFTKGTASGEDVEKRIITDCKVNPGNSGGPLCNTRGAVVGMVTAKSRISTHEDSYGLAIPADKLRAFLQENLPAAGKLPAVPASAKAMPLNEVYAKLSPSVVFIENTR
jgi:S1-C subfamily serine protease